MVEVKTSSRSMHENFVSGGTGCEFYEVLAILGLIVLSILHQVLVRSLLRFLPYRFKILRWCFDSVLLCLPGMVTLVIPGQLLNLCMILISLNIMWATILTFSAHRRAKEAIVIHEPPPDCGKLRHHDYFVPLSHTRGATMLITLVCILAVDFPLLPRRFAKTETHGFSLMDTGVGFFVCIAAAIGTIKKGNRFRSEVKGALGMFAFGCIRLLAVTVLDYQSPVHEYGVHLNFFICFAATKVICAIFYAVFPAWLDIIFGSGMYLLYQLSLQTQVVHFYLHSPDREGLFAANKEGLASIIGSSCLFLITTSVCRRFVYKVKICKSEWYYFVFQMTLLSGSCLTTSLLMHNDSVPVSRRLFNLSYALWMLSIFLMVLVATTLIRLIDIVSSCGGYNLVTLQHLSPKLDTVDDVLQALNQGAIWVFILGNVLTGLTNKALEGQLSNLGPQYSVPILTAYGCVLLCFVLSVYQKPQSPVKAGVREKKDK